jgi:hypothetical protein
MISRLPKRDPGLFDQQLIAGSMIEVGGLMLLEQLIVEVFGLASDTGTYMKEKQDRNDLSTPQDRSRTL